MPRLEDLTPGAQVKGILPGGPVTVISAKWHGTNVLELTYKDGEGRTDQALLYRDNEPALKIIEPGRQWSFTADGSVYTSPIIADGCIYALSSFETGGSTGNIYCINASTGTQIWNFTVIGYVYSALAVSGGYVYTGSGRGKAYALNASTGAQIWNFTTGNPVSSPTVAGDYVYMRSGVIFTRLTARQGTKYGIPQIGSGWVFLLLLLMV